MSDEAHTGKACGGQKAVLCGVLASGSVTIARAEGDAFAPKYNWSTLETQERGVRGNVLDTMSQHQPGL